MHWSDVPPWILAQHGIVPVAVTHGEDISELMDAARYLTTVAGNHAATQFMVVP